MKKIINIPVFVLLLLSWGCNDDDFLNRPRTSLLSEERVWADEGQVLSLLGNLYNRYYDIGSVKDWPSLAGFNEAFFSNAGSYGDFQISGWNLDAWRILDYGWVREINLFIQKCTATEKLSPETTDRFLAEARFLRASYYFEMVKRVVGVPLILELLHYDFSGDPACLQHPSAKESEVYDFIISEAEEIKFKLPATVGEKSKVAKGAALAMQARAALYAGSIAKYGATTPSVFLPGGEVGIPASMATGYFTKALNAAEEIISGSAGAVRTVHKKAGPVGKFFKYLS